MKILLLNPHIDAWRNILASWKARGDVVFVPENAKEAWQLVQLHGQSLDLAIVHREAGTTAPEAGIQFITKLKADPAYTDLPLILTSEIWRDPQFAEHQRSTQGAHAYLHCPAAPDPDIQDQLFKIINSIFGFEENAQENLLEAPSGPISIEHVADIFGINGKNELSSISLEGPETDETPLSPPPLPSESALSSDSVLSFDSALPGSETVPGLAMPDSSPADAIAEAIAAAKAETGTHFQFELDSDDAQDSSTPFLPEPDPVASPSVVSNPVARETTEFSDLEAVREMPYLFSKTNSTPAAEETEPFLFAQTEGDAIVPGGAADTPDLETIKKYLQLREKDVAVLSTQLKAARQQITNLSDQVQEERSKNTELYNLIEDQKKSINDLQKNKTAETSKLQNEIVELRFLMKAKSDKAKLLEGQVQEATDETERLKDRVRSDIRKIRVREKELENKLEIIRKDSEVLIGARESKIMELKRKLDTLEFNMDLLQDRYAREKDNSAKLNERLTKAAQVVRVAGGFLDSSGNPVDLSDLANSEDGQQEAS
ncbi:MAG: hypothetical protein A2X97_07570 [Bdellovibrionales bacterium GWA1_52_35]|nr:MAG: hypothetical protein A2X97_07570 [Bdellovibrionales bacterium GWA1_52_35]